MNKDLIAQLRKNMPSLIANEIASVQPMSESAGSIFKGGMSKVELENEGYKPVSRMGLMYIKDE